MVLNRDFPEHGLVAGDVGTPVHRYCDGSAPEVEVLRGDGATIPVVTAARGGFRLMQGRDALHVRSLAE